MLFAKDITIAVAANVSYALEALKEAFKQEHPNIRVKAILGSSGKLTAQISNGAPYALFMAANMNYPQSLFDKEIAITKPVIYAKGALAYFSTKAVPLSMQGVQRAQKIAIANPKTAPYGKASLEAITNAKLLDATTSKLIYAESISQVVMYAMHSVDMGFIAKSSLYSDKMQRFKEGIHWREVDSALYTPINQGMVLLKGASPEAKAFYAFMLSNRAKAILKRYGYLI